MANVLPVGALYKYVPHRRKVLKLYKKSLMHLLTYCIDQPMDVWSYERTLLRARFDMHKLEKNPKKAAMLLRLGEEEFWLNQHETPYYKPDSAESSGPLAGRFNSYKYANENFDLWSPEEKAFFPDFFAKRERWYKIRKDVWDQELDCLKEFDKKNLEANIAMTDELPAAKTKGGYPPFWWRTVARPLEHISTMHWFPYDRDSKYWF